jgi:vancomycin permeability regulator SanA
MKYSGLRRRRRKETDGARDPLNQNRSSHGPRLKWVGKGLRLALIPLVVWVGSIESINLLSRPYVYSTAKSVPNAPVGIVFGAGLQRSGRPSLILAQRLDGAIELYREHKVQRLLMSGDNRTADHNEPKAMRRYAILHSVPADDIDVDFGGRDTYDTCYRAKHVFGVDKAVFITQQYHAPRAVFIGRALGIDSVAFGVPNLVDHPAAQLSFTCREYCADLKAIWDASISHRAPYVDSGRRHSKAL